MLRRVKPDDDNRIGGGAGGAIYFCTSARRIVRFGVGHVGADGYIYITVVYGAPGTTVGRGAVDFGRWKRRGAPKLGYWVRITRPRGPARRIWVTRRKTRPRQRRLARRTWARRAERQCTGARARSAVPGSRPSPLARDENSRSRGLQ